jgi:hypothetical protein
MGEGYTLSSIKESVSKESRAEYSHSLSRELIGIMIMVVIMIVILTV